MPEKDTVPNGLAGWAEGTLTEDCLLGDAVTILQPRDGFRVAIDTILMAAAVPARAGQSVFEAGAGCGAAAICLARRAGGIRVAGIDIQPAIVALAGHNVRTNDLVGSVEIMTGDIGGDPPPRLQGPFDHAMANPPFLDPQSSNAPPNAGKATAMVEGTASLSQWVGGMHRVLKNKGGITMVWRADRLDDLVTALRPGFGEITIFPLWPKQGRAAKRVLIRARKNVAGPMTLGAGLVLHNADGSFTAEADAVLKGGALSI